MYTIKAGTTAAKAANGDIIVDMGQILRNLYGVEQDKEKKSLMQQILEPKEVDDSEKDTKKALQIARKIARGEPVTPQEKAFLMRVDPKLAQMAELARQQGERVRHALENASSKEEQQTIVMQAYQQVAEFTKANPQFGMLVGEAIKAAIQKAQKSASKESQLPQPEAPASPEADPKATPSADLPSKAEAEAATPADLPSKAEAEAATPADLPSKVEAEAATPVKIPSEAEAEAATPTEIPSETNSEASALDVAENSPQTQLSEEATTSPTNTQTQPARRNAEELQDALMAQFFPEEWASMLNCQG